MSRQKKENHQPLPDVGSVELTEEIVRQRAYELFEQRGCEHGHAMDDWLQAEAEIMGKKPASRADLDTQLHSAAA